jgi:myo-inositol 2-dehydrogenase/D-chiro-inositol 1-dehydrogenase
VEHDGEAGGGRAHAIGVGVVGAGLMGSAHVRTLAERVRGARVVAVADVDPARAAAAAARAPGARVHEDPRALIAAPEVEAVLVASSDETHEELVLACLAAGTPVLCEKPLAVTAQASRRVVEAEVRGGRRLVDVGFMRRFDPPYLAVKERLGRGEVGRPLMLHCAHRNASAPPGFTSEMLITSAGVHEIDVVRWLLGQEIAGALVLTPRPTSRAGDGLRDPQLLLLDTEDGVLVDVEVFVNARYGYEIRCELVGETGVARLHDHDGVAVAEDFRERFRPAYHRELQAWVDSLADGEGFGPTAWDGYVANVVADACLESLATGRRAEVQLPARPALYA